MDKISVIVPVYNVEQYLEKCINSILTQTHTNLEIILIDDGSTDTSGNICDKLAITDARITVIHKANTGVSDTRNHGLELSTGKYIAFIDSDDYIANNYFEKLYNASVENDAQIAICGFKKSYDNKTPDTDVISWEQTTILSGEDAVQYAMDKKHPFVGYVWGKLYSTDIIKKNKMKFDNSISLCEDSIFNCRILCITPKVVVIPNVLYFYCIRNNSATTSAVENPKRLATKIKARRETLEIAKRYPNSPFEQRAYDNLFIAIISTLVSAYKVNQVMDEEQDWIAELKEIYPIVNKKQIPKKMLLYYFLLTSNKFIAKKIVHIFIS